MELQMKNHIRWMAGQRMKQDIFRLMETAGTLHLRDDISVGDKEKTASYYQELADILVERYYYYPDTQATLDLIEPKLNSLVAKYTNYHANKVV